MCCDRAALPPHARYEPFCRYSPPASWDVAFDCGDQTAVPVWFGWTSDSESKVSEASG
jgi:hypothetical protein